MIMNPSHEPSNPVGHAAVELGESSLQADAFADGRVASSSLHAWLYLVRLSWQRQARARQMVWLALGLLAFAVAFTAINTAGGWWGMQNWRFRGFPPPALSYSEVLTALESWRAACPWPSGPAAIQDMFNGTAAAAMQESGPYVFSQVLFSILIGFLLPIWSLSFATDAVGGDRESGSLVWLFTRPLSRPAIYLARFVALLPWSLGLNLAGFGLICLAAGRPGRIAFGLYWPAILCSTLCFSALFMLMGAVFRRPAIIAIVYSFFLETIFGNMPGYLKRVSISFYARCMMFDAGRAYDVQPEKPSVYLSVSGESALWVLLTATVLLLVIGMAWFARAEYRTSES